MTTAASTPPGPRPPATLSHLAWLLLAVLLAAHLLIVAAPGFFSHDEWNRCDEVSRYGLAKYLHMYFRVCAGPSFAHPVRPIGFLDEGLNSLFMRRLPVVPHLFDVTLHAANAILLLLALHAAGMKRQVAWLAALLFALSPLTPMTTGWTAASFDLWYTLFVLASAWVAILIWQQGASLPKLLLLTLFSAAAICSKETAMVLPLALALTALTCAWAGKERINWQRLAAIVATSAVPVASYLLIRLPALRRSFSGPQKTTYYTPSLSAVPGNLLHYLAYPFFVNVDQVFKIQHHAPQITLALLLIQILLAAALMQRLGVRFGLLYLGGYLLFLLPVLTLQGSYSHYLYASAIPMSVALAALLTSAWQKRHWLTMSGLTAITFCLTAHFASNELAIYQTARCQSRFLDSLDTRMAVESTKGTRLLFIQPEPGAPADVGIQAIIERPGYGGGNPTPEVTFDPSRFRTSDPSEVRVTMNSQCEVR
ncbi:MAG: hypothetical protein M0Z90_00835 [Desulfobacteraceae bacterium]|nr:hypothetical protein [Desulfobacteraceae bacterium]